MIQKNLKTYSFILILLTLFGCSDDSSAPQKLIDSSDLFLELTLEGEKIRYEGQNPLFINSGFILADDIAYQNFYIPFRNDLADFPQGQISILNFRSFAIDGNSSFSPDEAPSITNSQIIDIVNTSNWSIARLSSTNIGGKITLGGEEIDVNDVLFTIGFESETSYFNFSEAYESKIYYSDSDSLSEEEFVILDAEFRTELGSINGNIVDVTGKFTAAVNGRSLSGNP